MTREELWENYCREICNYCGHNILPKGDPSFCKSKYCEEAENSFVINKKIKLEIEKVTELNMTRKEAKVLLPIIQAYAEGKTIQAIDTTDPCGTWNNVTNLKINTDFEKYRIKPEFKYRPFKDTEECLEEMQKHQPFGWITNGGYWYNIVSAGVASVKIINTQGAVVTLLFSTLLSQYEFVDGALLGVKKEE